MTTPKWIAKREFNRRGMFAGTMDYDDALALSIASLKEYGARYPHWMLSYSGGKDSNALVSFVLWCIREKHIEAPETLTVMYADTRMELPPLHITAMQLLDIVKADGYNVRIIQPEMNKRFFVYMLGRGVPPPKNSMRWCTRILKAEPIKKAQDEIFAQYGGNVLNLTGVRKGESAARDERISTSCSKHDGECGQGWFQQARNSLAPLMHWRVCWVWKWLYSDQQPYRVTQDIAAVYAADDLEDIRTGCIACHIVEEDRALKYLVRKPGWQHLAPLMELRGVYDWLMEPRQRHRRVMPSLKKDGLYSDNAGALGALTMAAREEGLNRVLALQAQTGYTLIDAEEEAVIRGMWRDGVYPQGWTGAEPTGAEPYIKYVVRGGQIVERQNMIGL